MKSKAKHSYGSVTNEFRQVIIEHINANLKEYLIFSIVFIIGVMIGVVVINNADVQSKSEVSGYIISLIEGIKNENFEVDKFELMKNSFYENLKLVILMWIAGSTIIGIPLIYIITAYKGFCIGYTISAILSSLGIWNGIGFSFKALFLQNLIIIPVILMLSVSSLKLYRALIKVDKTSGIKQEIIRHSIFCGILIVPLGISSFVEAFISTGLVIM